MSNLPGSPLPPPPPPPFLPGPTTAVEFDPINPTHPNPNPIMLVVGKSLITHSWIILAACMYREAAHVQPHHHHHHHHHSSPPPFIRSLITHSWIILAAHMYREAAHVHREFDHPCFRVVKEYGYQLRLNLLFDWSNILGVVFQ
ncbi:hypothetical protein CMV_004355 [Castanea mollissima]|uniref:Uncharacterized protein n=1 Tax=Castanea mollissima TaxID=60419 RepID=A0A8J4VVD1_9ROSI|nr:hypothetical protein CMV_004355 [Castanea mollissima]